MPTVARVGRIEDRRTSGCAARCSSPARPPTRARARSSPGSAAGWPARGCRSRRSRRRTCRNNSVVTVDGGEIGRAQAMQAHACGLAPSVAINPVLLKPGSDRSAPGRACSAGRTATVSARSYRERKAALLDVVTATLADLRARYDVVVCEGAGSPAEINLRADRHREHGPGAGRRLPVVVVGDIDRGGVLAHLFGTVALLSTRPTRRGSRGSSSTSSAATRRCSRPGLDQLPRAHRPPDARGAAVVRTAVARRGGLALRGRRRGARPPGAAAREPVAAGGGRPVARGSPTPPTSTRWPASRASRCATSPSRPRWPTPTSWCCPARGDRRRPRLAAPHRARRRGASPTPRRAGRCSASAAATRCSGGASPTRTASKAVTAERPRPARPGDRVRRREVWPTRSARPGASRCAATRSTTAAWRAPATRALLDGRRAPTNGRRARHPLARRCWRTTGSAARCSRRVGRAGRPRPGSAAAPDTAFAAERAAQLDLLGDLVAAAPRHRRAANMSSITVRRADLRR